MHPRLSAICYQPRGFIVNLQWRQAGRLRCKGRQPTLPRFTPTFKYVLKLNWIFFQLERIPWPAGTLWVIFNIVVTHKTNINPQNKEHKFKFHHKTYDQVFSSMNESTGGYHGQNYDHEMRVKKNYFYHKHQTFNSHFLSLVF